MTESDIRQYIELVSSKRSSLYPKPTFEDWNLLQSQLGCEFCKDFMNFSEIICEYQFPMEFFGVSTQQSFDGDGSIWQIYQLELEGQKDTAWDKDLVPFAGVGNGDCYCFRISDKICDTVFYVYHEDGFVDQLYTSFGLWVQDLPELLRD